MATLEEPLLSLSNNEDGGEHSVSMPMEPTHGETDSDFTCFLDRLEASNIYEWRISYFIASLRSHMTNRRNIELLYLFGWFLAFIGWVYADLTRILNVLIFAVVVTVIFLSIATVVMGSFTRHHGQFVSKTPSDVLLAFTLGMLPGTFAISYAWADKTKRVARRMSKFFPEGVCWIDVRNILPGHSIQETCTKATGSANVGIIFLSAAYLRSANSRLELLNLEPECLPILAKHFPNWVDDLLDSAHSPNADATERLRQSSYFQRQHHPPAKLVIFVAADLLHDPEIEEQERAFRREIVNTLQDNGHQLVPEETTSHDQLERRTARVLLEALLNLRAFSAVYQTQETTPAINEEWHGTAATLYRTMRLQILSPFCGLVVWVVMFFLSFAYFPIGLPTVTHSLLFLLQLFLTLTGIALHLALVFAVRGGYKRSTLRWLWLFNWFIPCCFVWWPMYGDWMEEAINFASLPDVAHILAVIVRLKSARRVKVYTSGALRSSTERGIKTLHEFEVIEQVDQPDDADFSVICLDKRVNDMSNTGLFDDVSDYVLSVPDTLDVSGNTLYWTRHTYSEVRSHNPVNVRAAMIKCAKGDSALFREAACPRIETILVQVLKGSLGLPITARVTLGHGDFRSIDTENLEPKTWLQQLQELF